MTLWAHVASSRPQVSRIAPPHELGGGGGGHSDTQEACVSWQAAFAARNPVMQLFMQAPVTVPGVLRHACLQASWSTRAVARQATFARPQAAEHVCARAG
jgi:hypothetical protein